MVAVDKRVLVVDDEAIIRKSYQRVLTDAGYIVRAVGSGGEALQACRADRFDVVLADLKMPDMDGLEVARTMKKEFPDVRVVIITGYPSRTSAEQASRLGVFDYLEKPLTPDRLSAATARAAAAPQERGASTDPTTAPDCDADVPVETDALDDMETSKSEAVAERDVSTLKGLGLLAVAPLIGLAYVLLMPLIGFGMLLSVLGTGLAEQLGWMRRGV